MRPAPIVWITGLSGAGKTSLAQALQERLRALGHEAAVLDGDRLRHGLNAGLGFSTEDRFTAAQRAAEEACRLAGQGMVVLVALISPDAPARLAARQRVTSAGHPFLEVYLRTPLAVCEARDAKGLYARARRGEIANFVGLHIPYEAPAQPEVSVPPEWDPATAAEAVLQALPLSAR